MKSAPTIFVFAACLFAALAGTGCNSTGSSTAERRPIPLSPVGVTGTGIGTPGGGSADTRATGTIASGEGEPIGVTNPASAPLANPGTTNELPANTVGNRSPR